MCVILIQELIYLVSPGDRPQQYCPMIDSPWSFNRNFAATQLKSVGLWDVLIIGGGATGLGIALDAASRGYKTLLLEQSDFAKGTSSRSTKLVHGGVRYLAQGNFKLVLDALRERGLLLKNAPHLVKKQAFIIPCYSWFEVARYLTGLKIYDWMAGKYSFGNSRFLSRDKVLQEIPEIRKEGLKGGVLYYDGKFDDARLAIAIAQTAAAKGAVLMNYAKVTALLKTAERISGVQLEDLETAEIFEIRSKVVINATGVYVDQILKLDKQDNHPIVRPSQGVHIVLHRSFMNTKQALLIPKTSDGRVLFAIPWHEHVLIGTTDTALEKAFLEPVALEQEIDFILNTAGLYLSKAPRRIDILSIFAGLRPLAATQGNQTSTKEISRDHKLMVSDSGLITITGGKWTTYRKMAEETTDKAILTGNLSPALCVTKTIRIHDLRNEEILQQLLTQRPELAERLDPGHPDLRAEVILAVRYQMARTVEDVLARRLRVLFIDANAAIRMAPLVAELMAGELQQDKGWQEQQVELFSKLAANYTSP